MTRSRFLFAIWDGGGNLPPMLSLARSLVEHGHSVCVLAPKTLQARIEDTGCGFSAYERVPNGVPAAAGSARAGRLHASFCMPELVRAAPSLAFAEDLLTALEHEAADALVVDFMLAGALAAAERTGLPTAALMHTVYCLPVRSRPPFGAALPPARGRLGRLRDATLSAVRERAHQRASDELNAARRTLGLAPVPSAAAQLARVERVLVLTTEAFDAPPAERPPNVRWVGPQLDPPQAASDDDEPLVLVSFSSRFAAPDAVQRVVDALAGLRLRALVTLGASLRASDLRPPPNVDAHTYLPHADVLPHARLVITHAGLGTVMAALAHGVPLLCIPLKNDQYENAARIVAAGAGRSMSRRAQRSSLRQAVLDLLDDFRWRAGAERMARAIAADHGRAVGELEELANAAAENLTASGPAACKSHGSTPSLPLPESKSPRATRVLRTLR